MMDDSSEIVPLSERTAKAFSASGYNRGIPKVSLIERAD